MTNSPTTPDVPQDVPFPKVDTYLGERIQRDKVNHITEVCNMIEQGIRKGFFHPISPNDFRPCQRWSALAWMAMEKVAQEYHSAVTLMFSEREKSHPRPLHRCLRAYLQGP